jgi:predicted Zn-dependent peptidase
LFSDHSAVAPRWPSDVESISREAADEFFATYYAPNNITAVLVGDFDPDEAIALAERYYGRIPRGAQDPPEVVTEEIEQAQPRRMRAVADTNPSVRIRWHAVPFVHKDSYALDLLASILRARTGRLYKALVEESGLATGEPFAGVSRMKYGGSFTVGAELAEGKSHEQLEAALLAEIERIKKEPIGERELQKVKNQSLANSFRRLQSTFFLLLQLLVYDAWGDWHYLNEAPARLQAVTAEDLVRVAETYLTESDMNVLWYERKAGTKEDPELAALPQQQRDMVKQMLAQVQQVDDPAQLRMQLSMMQEQAGNVPPEARATFDLLAKKIKERIAEIEAAAGEEN